MGNQRRVMRAPRPFVDPVKSPGEKFSLSLVIALLNWFYNYSARSAYELCETSPLASGRDVDRTGSQPTPIAQRLQSGSVLHSPLF